MLAPVPNLWKKQKGTAMQICGWDALANAARCVEFDAVISGVHSPALPPAQLWLAPGFVDLQVNGFAGVDFNNPAVSLHEIDRAMRALFSTGVTRFLPTVITGPPEDMLAALSKLAEARRRLREGEAIAGIHLEGPYISPEEGPRGAHPAAWVRAPDWEEFRRFQQAAEGLIRIVTLAPEWPEAPAFIRALVSQGVTVAIGHTNASGEQIAQAVAAGATVSTHLGNGAHSLLPRHPNYIWEQLAEDRLSAGFIVDGIHLPACFLKVALRAKGLTRAFLVTDASAPANCPPGRYRLGPQEVDLTPDQRVVLAGQQRLAGSALRMDRGIEKLMKLAGLSLAEAIAMATLNPARVARIEGRQKGLQPEDWADLVEFHFQADPPSLSIHRTWLAGRLVYAAEQGR